jgi:hypothetical protein
MYEDWVEQADLSAVTADISMNPDHPVVKELSPNASKRDRTGWAMIHTIQSSKSCLRGLFAHYLSDTQKNGLSLFDLFGVYC